MIKQDFILLIMNCKKYQKKAVFQKKTWLPLLPRCITYYHVIGDETMDESFKFDNENQILWIRVADDYNSLPKKVIQSYEAINSTFDFQYIFKTDDDQVLVNHKFFDMLTTLIIRRIPKTHYGGYIVDIKQPYLSQYYKLHPELPKHLPLYATKYCSGRFYFLSRQACVDLIYKKENIKSEYLEDYAIGFYLNDFFKKNILHLATNHFFTDIELSDYDKMVKEGQI
jgi:hypothetical protein